MINSPWLRAEYKRIRNIRKQNESGLIVFACISIGATWIITAVLMSLK